MIATEFEFVGTAGVSPRQRETRISSRQCSRNLAMDGSFVDRASRRASYLFPSELYQAVFSEAIHPRVFPCRAVASGSVLCEGVAYWRDADVVDDCVNGGWARRWWLGMPE